LFVPVVKPTSRTTVEPPLAKVPSSLSQEEPEVKEKEKEKDKDSSISLLQPFASPPVPAQTTVMMTTSSSTKQTWMSVYLQYTFLEEIPDPEFLIKKATNKAKIYLSACILFL
jgi:hypothetical protein